MPLNPVAGNSLSKKYDVFVSYNKGRNEENVSTARILSDALKKNYGKKKVFIDLTNLEDLRNIPLDVKNSKVLVLLQTKFVLTRPWCLIELYTAITIDIPVIPVYVSNGGYDHEEAKTLLNSESFAVALDQINPSGSKDLKDNPEEVARKIRSPLSDVI